jgi:DNA-binding winged helix-turn-helix (wHTH) protein/Tfp pilus assembly protein PilF
MKAVGSEEKLKKGWLVRFGSFEVDEKAFQLREQGRPVRLERIPLELLILLARNRSRLVTRDEIVAQIWGVNHYLESESAVHTAVRKLRKALKDDAAQPQIVETVPGKGYRFIAAIREEAQKKSPQAPDPEAIKHFLRGRHHWNKKTPHGYERAIELFQEAIDHDAAFAPPFVGLAYCLVMQGIHGLKRPVDVYPLARAAASAALEIDAYMAEATTALADITKGFDWEWKLAEQQYRRALELNPEYAVSHQWYANLLSIVGRHEQAIAHAVEARRCDPLSVGTAGFLGFTLYRARRFDDAVKECQRTVEFHRQSPIAAWFLAHALIQTGSMAEADRCLSATLEATCGSGMYMGLLAYVKGRVGRRAEAEEITQGLEKAARCRYVSPFDLATAHLGLRNYDPALHYIRKAISERVMRVTELPMPIFDEVRSDPLIAKFCADLEQ